MATKMDTNKQATTVKYKASCDLNVYYADITKTGMSKEAAKNLADGKSITKAMVGPGFAYMLKNKLIEKE